MIPLASIQVECELMLQEESGRRLASPIFLPSPVYRHDEETPMGKHNEHRHHNGYRQFPVFPSTNKNRKDLVMVPRMVYPSESLPPNPSQTHHGKYSSILKPFRWAGAIRRMKAQSL
eukprot:Gregarina_sp_Poly_1__9970@NODE_65_length_16489_cov_69_850445_g56_i0_p10_GENE_NODE_65_length_16489_cov_69_850445_g56_i0NODE_65_length_16489_cov_69_850445_g56_i0_p10_ORF_typecomplete_len117_score14_60_NODE_65_length_16489_cov_69_850445_g56_i01270713057